jgi:hypothetical protein
LFRGEIKAFSAFFKGCPDYFNFWIVLNMFPIKFKPFVEIIQAGESV